ncbi:hypothetical protein VNO77_12216 [Canavalia gladiata]|uniref:ATPase AAA-type core domain-containing protein n=1 Tax=Canavalia gladiata TaxID=3824 RepID=A0AAN9QPW5_CANGL
MEFIMEYIEHIHTSVAWIPEWLDVLFIVCQLNLIPHLIKFFSEYRRYNQISLERNETMEVKSRIVQIYYWAHGCWNDSALSNPTTFRTLVLRTTLKKYIIRQLNLFLDNKEICEKEGKPWKHKYIFYGPPGTGISTIIAAMANHTKFDVYDLKLSSFYSYSDLQRAITQTTNPSILVIEDVHRIQEVESRGITLPNLLDFMDGLWSEESRIIVLTAEDKKKVDILLLLEHSPQSLILSLTLRHRFSNAI